MNQSEHSRQNHPSTLRELADILRQRLPLAAFVTALVFSMACVATFLMPSQYDSKAVILVGCETDEGADPASQIALSNSTNAYLATQLDTYPGLVKTSAILTPIIRNLDLHMSVDELADHVSVNQEGNSQLLLAVNASSDDPSRAKRIADMLIDGLKEHAEDTPVTITTMQNPEPGTKTTPKIALNLSAGMMLSILLGVCAALTRNALDSRIRRGRDAGEIADVPVLARIGKAQYASEPGAVVLDHPHSATANTFRKLCTKLALTRHNSQGTRVLAVSSVNQDGGKTFATINLAAAFAQAGNKVLLVDADIQNHAIANTLHMDNHTGLMHVISGQISTDKATQQYGSDNFHVLPAGTDAPYPNVTINLETMRLFMRQMGDRYDCIVIDTAPMETAMDSTIFANLGADLLLVVDCGHTRKQSLRDAMEDCRTVNTSIAGIISINDTL